jgi:HPt (histidine-containing phosphotransfer) domain-containing protein
MDDLVVKPASTATMLAALRRWLPHLQWPVETAAPALEPGVLDELTAGDPDLRDELLTGYLESLRDDLDAIATALDAGDAPAVRRRAHQIAGASRTVGAAAVVADAVRVERCDGDADALRPLAAALATHLDHGGPACA